MRGRALAALAVMIGLGLAGTRWPGAVPVAAAQAGPAAQAAQAAQAGQAARATVIAVLPLAAQERGLDIYSKPVADALARELGTRLSASGAFVVEALADGSSAPGRVDLVIDGRIVAAAPGRVSLEAQVRDPERGARVGFAATRIGALNRIDELASALAGRLTGPVSQAAAARRRRARQPIVMAGSVIEVEPDGALDRGGAAGDAAGGSDGRPALLVFEATGQAADGAVPVTATATRAGYRMAADLGFRPVAARREDLGSIDQVAAVMRRHQARYGLVLQVENIDFAWYGVLAARGTFRVLLIDDQGRPLLDRTHRTGTLVGSRGDRHAALVGFVMDQARDIAVPELVARVAAHQRMRSR